MGCQVGDLYMRLIHTFDVDESKPFDFLTKSQRDGTVEAAGERDSRGASSKGCPFHLTRFTAASPVCGAASSCLLDTRSFAHLLGCRDCRFTLGRAQVLQILNSENFHHRPKSVPDLLGATFLERRQ